MFENKHKTACVLLTNKERRPAGAIKRPPCRVVSGKKRTQVEDLQEIALESGKTVGNLTGVTAETHDLGVQVAESDKPPTARSGKLYRARFLGCIEAKFCK